ncbi:OmpA family protein [Acidisoma cellulosilytica]|uniref:OmpA family protein n=1 Tax=Acidisoma cellulosilyticum TaxID=2802395 RepID=A0A964E2C6_9PROT|nr:OmpA family protein [Acidisoma cellulosilyticum]MCB8879465.1 OmpA family protein [Acidisoma cellulosilyticum]
MRWLIGLPLLLSVTACAAFNPPLTPGNGQRFPIFFAPVTSTLANGADSVVASAAKFAQANPTDPVTLVAYGAPPGHNYVEPADIDAERASAVTAQLIADGVDKNRISAVAKGPVQPEVPMSKIEVRRVDIIVGTPPANP